MTELDTGIARFQALIAETPALWRSIDIRVLARESDGEKHNLICTATLSRRRATESSAYPNLPESPPVVCYQRISAAETLDALLCELREGAITFGDVTVTLRKRTSGPAGSPGPYDFGYLNRASQLQRPPDREGFSIGHSLTAYGDASEHLYRLMDNGIEGLNNALRRLPAPWDGVESIARYFLQTNTRIDYHRAASFEVFAPLDARFNSVRCSLSRGTLRYSVLAAAETSLYLRLGYFAVREDGEVDHGEVALGSGPSNSALGLLQWEGSIAIRGAKRALLFLSVANSNVEKVEVVDPTTTKNPRVIGYSLLDPDLSVLRWQLAPERNSKLFEKAVMRIFGFAGFLIDGYAFEDHLTDGPDGIAFAPDNSAALVIECTLDPIDVGKGKLGQLISRTVRLRESLGDSAPEIVLPILVTSAPQQESSASGRRNAGVDGIALLCREDLEGLLDLTMESAALSSILNFCLERVPKEPTEDELPVFGSQ